MSIFDIQPNKVSTNLIQYPIVLMSETSGQGKTTIMMNLLKALCPEKEPLFLEFEDRYQHIPGIMAKRIHDSAELEMVKNELFLPQAKEMFSCVVIDTADAMDAMIEKSVAMAQEVEITGELKFGQGNKRISSREYFIDELKSKGWQVFFCCQCSKSTDIIRNITTYEQKLNKVTWAKINEPAFAIGMISCDLKGQRSVDFTASQTYPNLKNSLGLPKGKIKVEDLPNVIKESVKKMGGDFSTNSRTVAVEEKEEMTFEQIVEKGNDLGNKLYAKSPNETLNILKTTLGCKDSDNKQPKGFADLNSNQFELAKLCLIKLQNLAKKHNL